MNPAQSAAAANLRRRAKERLKEKPGKAFPEVSQSGTDQARLLHELQVHQIELEMQNEELRASQAQVEKLRDRYFDFYDFSPSGFVSLESGGTIIQINLTGARLLGRERTRLPGRRFDAFVSAADRPAFNAFLQKVFATETDQTCEVALAGTSRSPTFVQIEATLSPDKQECRAVLVDITEHRRTKALRESEANFRTFFEAIGDMIVIASPDGKIMCSNQALIHKLGYSAAELARMHVLDLHPASQRRVAEEIFAAMFRGEKVTCPLPLIDRNGTLVPVETRVWFGQWNGSKCMFALCKDLSAEQEAQQRFECLFRNNPALMALSILPEQTFMDVNDAFIKVLGYSKNDVVGKTVAELGLFPNPEQQSLVAEQLLANGRITDVELKVRSKDGATFDGLFSGEVICNQGHRYFLVVMIDVTARKQLEAAEEIRRRNTELESRVRQRTATIRKLATELTLAEQRERSRLSNILHEELQQLIVGARYLLQNAQESMPKEERKQIGRVDRILSETVLVVRNLAVEISPPILRDEGLAATLKWLGIWMKENHGLTVKVSVAPDLPPLSEELSIILYQAVRELLFNVFKHAQVKAARVTMKGMNDHLTIVVSDKGVGFAPARPQPCASSSGKLGLASMRERLSLLDGLLEIDSSPNQGSRISLRVPLHPFQAEDDARSPQGLAVKKRR